MTKPLADQLEVWGFENDTVVFTDGSLGFGLEVTPLDISCFDNAATNAVVESASQILNSLPPGLSLQFVQDIKSGNDKILDQHLDLGKNASKLLVQTITKARVKRLKTWDEAGELPRHQLYIFVRFRPATQKRKLTLFSKNVLFPNFQKTKFESDLVNLSRIKGDLIKSFESLGLASCELSATDVLTLMYLQWNPGRIVGLGSVDMTDVRSSLLFSDVFQDQSGFSVGPYFHRVVTLKTMPEITFSGMASKLRELPFDTRLTLSILVPDQQKEMETLQLQRRLAFSMVSGKKSGVSDLESEAKLTDLETLIEQMISQGEKVFHFSLSVLVRSQTKEELESLVSTVLMKLRELSGAEAMIESLASFDVFKNVAIPHCNLGDRKKPIKTSNLADFLPLYGPWTGHDLPSALLRSRMGSLVKFDPFAKELTNANQIVSGGSGAGKSFFANNLMMQLLKENPKVFIIDIGGSYQKLCRTLDGQYVPLRLGAGMSLNPFDLLPGHTKADEQKIKFLVGLLELMTKEDDEKRLPRLERSEVEGLIKEVYDNSNDPKLSDLQKLMAKHEDVGIKKLSKILASWSGDSPFGQFVDKSSTIELERDIVCFDLKGLESYPDLQAVCLYIITDFLWRKIQQDKSSKKFLIYDECWKLLENEAGCAFIGEAFRTFRKYFASAIAISQNIDDFARSKIATAILPNASVKWILRQKGADLSRLKETLNLNDNEVDLIGSLHQERGLYSEAFLIAGDSRSVVAIESTPLEYWIATTDPRETSFIETYHKEHPQKSELEILQDLAAKYPRGLLA